MSQPIRRDVTEDDAGGASDANFIKDLRDSEQEDLTRQQFVISKRCSASGGCRHPAAVVSSS